MKNIDPKDLSQNWEALRSGDIEGLDGIFRCFSDELFQYGLSLVFDQDFIQDCIQDVFVDLWKYHKNLQKAENVKSYLLRSLNHKIFREIKKNNKQKLEKSLWRIEASDFLDSRESDIVNGQREERLQQKLAAALHALPIRQKEVLQLLFFENISYEEASKLMGINLRSVYTLAWKAISNLKKAVFLLMVWLSF